MQDFLKKINAPKTGYILAIDNVKFAFYDHRWQMKIVVFGDRQRFCACENSGQVSSK